MALGEVSAFVRENREVLGRNITGLNRVSKVLVKQRGALDEILNVAPVALNNLALTYNPQAGTLDTRANQGEVGNQIARRPRGVPVRHRRPGRHPGGGLQRDQAGLPPSTAAPSAGRRATRRRTGSTRRSADSWRCTDDPA